MSTRIRDAAAFEPTSDPRSYVPRPATEELLDALTAYLRVGATRIALRGPVGAGKTLLLRVLASRLAGSLRVVYVPYPALAADEIAAWILDLLGERPAAEPERQLVSLARSLRAEGSGLVLLLDDAESTPLPTLRRLSRLVGEARPSLRVVLAVPDDAAWDPVIEAVGPGVEVLQLEGLMTPAETAHHLAGRLAQSGCEESLRRGFVEAHAEALHAASGGTPAELERLAGPLWEQHAASAAQRRAHSEPARLHGLAGALLAGPEPGDENRSAATATKDTAAEQPTPESTAPVGEAATEAVPVARPVPPASRFPYAAVTGALVAALVLGFLTGRMSTRVPLPGAATTSAPAVAVTPEVAVAPGTATDAAPTETSATTPPEQASAGVAALPPVSAPAPERPISSELAREGAEPPEVELHADAVPTPEVELHADAVPTPEVELQAAAEAAPEIALHADAVPTPEIVLQAAAEAAPAEKPAASAVSAAPPSSPPDEAQARRPRGLTVRVNINAVPWAYIEIDGEPVGATPVAEIPLKPGPHEFRAIFADGRESVRVEKIDELNKRVIFR